MLNQPPPNTKIVATHPGIYWEGHFAGLHNKPMEDEKYAVETFDRHAYLLGAVDGMRERHETE
jgi:hypothetical protein